MNIGQNLALLRREKGFTQQQLADKLGVSVQAVSKWETNVCAPDVGHFPILAELFGVSIDRLFGFRLSEESEMRTIVEEADRCETPEENIALLLSGLERFPNSSTLRLALAMSYLTLARTDRCGADVLEQCVRLCREVIQLSGDRKQVDGALETLRRAHLERGEYDQALECVERLSAESYHLRIVGGGSQDRLLNQFSANAIARPVLTGPVEATALGNAALQAIACGQFRDLTEAREAIAESFPQETFLPQDEAAWNEAYERYLRITGEKA